MTDKTQALLPVTRHPTQVKGNCPTCGHGQSHSLPGDAWVQEVSAILKAVIPSLEVKSPLRDRIAAALTPSPCPGDGRPAWRTIDSAPTDGQTILAICTSAYTPTAFDTWWQDGWTHYSRPDDKWHGGVGKWFPTHWMPREAYLAALTPSALSGEKS